MGNLLHIATATLFRPFMLLNSQDVFRLELLGGMPAYWNLYLNIVHIPFYPNQTSLSRDIVNFGALLSF